jgi:16S rRNA processing protein RimM
MADPRWVRWGRLGRPHGLRGEIKLHPLNPQTGYIERLGELRLELGERTLLTQVTDTREAGGDSIVVLDGIGDRTAAEAWVNAEVLVPESLFEKAEDGEFYGYELEGMTAVDSDGRKVGRIFGLADFGAGDLLDVEYRGQRIFVPFADPYVGAIDRAARTIVVSADDLAE